MAIASKQTAAPSSAAPSGGYFFRAVDAIYRFLASLKLAVITLSSLASVLALATVFESGYGTSAVQQYIYRSPLFILLLTFLAINVFCAAAIRFPWKRRQTGFVVTHLGILILLFGSFVSVRWSDEGEMGIPEGSTSDWVVRRDHMAIRVQVLSKSGEVNQAYSLPFNPGVFPWSDGASIGQTLRNIAAIGLGGLGVFGLYWWLARPRWLSKNVGVGIASALGSAVVIFGYFAWVIPPYHRADVLTDGEQPFKVVAKDYLPSASLPMDVHEPGPDGVPMLRLALLVKAPNAPKAEDQFGGRGWIVASHPRFARATRNTGPALIAFQFAPREREAELVDDFLHPPKDPLTDEVARLRYPDRAGKPRVFEWKLNGVKDGDSVALPESDLSVTLITRASIPAHGDAQMGGMAKMTGESAVHLLHLRVVKGKDAPLDHLAIASLPLVPPLLPGDQGKQPLVQVGYFYPPEMAAKSATPMMGRLGVIEVLATEQGKLYYRAFGREGLMGAGPVREGELVNVFGGGARMPMQIGFRVDEFLKSGVTRQVCEPLELSKEMRDEAVPAALVHFSAGGDHADIWVRRNYTLDDPFTPKPHRPIPTFTEFSLGEKRYQIAFDFDRRRLPFDLKLTDFDPGKDPGSASPATFTSQVLLTDPSADLAAAPRVITMNEPLTHRDWTFYQSRYLPDLDPETGDPEGLYQSVFQVHYDPAWWIVYAGCILIVTGTFIQFYMRSGVFYFRAKPAAAAAAGGKHSGANGVGHAVQAVEALAAIEADL